MVVAGTEGAGVTPPLGAPVAAEAVTGETPLVAGAVGARVMVVGKQVTIPGF